MDLGGSLAVASRGLYSTGVSTDLNGMYRSILRSETELNTQKIVLVTYLLSGGRIGNTIRAEVNCDKCMYRQPYGSHGDLKLT